MTNHLHLMYLYLNPDNIATDNSSSSFEYKSSENFGNRNTIFRKTNCWWNIKIAVLKCKIAAPLKYLSNFWWSWGMSLINCKIYLELNWTKNCVNDQNETKRIR